MCGFVGIVRIDERRIDTGLLSSMADLIKHRGPDDSGIWVGNGAGLCHQRLSIIDLSQAGREPMKATQNPDLLLVFNGEIYNFKELRRETRDYVYQSNTDAEVLLGLYCTYGENFLHKLRGMYAFAIWDNRLRRLFAAVDYVGKKPFYYVPLKDGGLAFSSELRPLMLISELPKDIDTSAVYHYLIFQYVPSPQTILKGFYKLQRGHSIVWEVGKGLTIRCYDPPSQWSKTCESEPESVCSKLRRILCEAVELRLISDVPLGALLSGGIDSSAVVAVMSKLSENRVETFSVGFKESAFDETPYARRIAKLYRTKHHEFTITPNAAELIPFLAWHYSEPFGDASAIPTYCICALARKYVKVILTGDGGDEMLGGYSRYMFSPLGLNLNYLPRRLRKSLLTLVRDMIPRHKPLIWRLRQWAEDYLEDRHTAYLTRVGYFNDKTLGALCNSDFSRYAEKELGLEKLESHLSHFNKLNFFDSIMRVDRLTYLPDDILVKTDIASMATGLEARCPLLDKKFVDYANLIPWHLKFMWPDKQKIIFKDCIKDLLPQEILSRGKKGFGIPLYRWYQGPLFEMAWDMLTSSNSKCHTYLRGEKVAQLLSEHRRGIADYGYQIHALVMLEQWHRTFGNGVPPRPAPPKLPFEERTFDFQNTKEHSST